MSLDTEDIEPEKPRPDFRRANGAPQIIDREGKNQRYSRPSGWGKELDDESALVNWKVDRAAIGVAGDPALQARYQAVKKGDRDTLKKLREDAINAGRGDEASDIGTALHAMSERWEDPDDDFHPGSPYEESLKAYSSELERLGLVSELFEYQVANDEYRAAGTCDRLYKLTRPLVTPKGEILPVGTLLIGDLKTGGKLEFSQAGYSIQMAIYALGEFYNVETDTYMPTPEINVDWGLLVHMPSKEPGRCEILWVDLQVGNYGAWLVKEVRDWRKAWRSGAYCLAPINVDPWPEPDPADARSVEEVVDNAQWTSDMVSWVQFRLDKLRDHSEAVTLLQRKWPEGVPTPKNGLAQPQDIEAVLNVLDFVEAEFGITFPEGDPRVQPGVHKDDLPVTNTPPERGEQEARSGS